VAAGTPLNLPTLLVVEDDPVLGLELTDFLRSEGFDVVLVAGVQQAEQALQRPFDLLVLDLNLPDGSGAELCVRLRPYVRSGIVVCTGRSERELRHGLLRGGADAFLVKPVDPEELSAVLASVLRRVAPPPASPMRASVPPPSWRLDSLQQCLFDPSGQAVGLSAAEGLFLAALFAKPGVLVERSALFDLFAAEGLPMTAVRLEALVSRLRAKVVAAGGHRLPLGTSYGRGYHFKAHAQVLRPPTPAAGIQRPEAWP